MKAGIGFVAMASSDSIRGGIVHESPGQIRLAVHDRLARSEAVSEVTLTMLVGDLHISAPRWPCWDWLQQRLLRSAVAVDAVSRKTRQADIPASKSPRPVAARRSDDGKRALINSVPQFG